MIVKDELKRLHLPYRFSIDGAIEFPDGISIIKKNALKNRLQKSGLDLLDVNESLLIDKIIQSIFELIHETDRLPKIDYEDIVSDYLGAGSKSILKIFSEVMGVSLTHYIIYQKIDRAKEMLLNSDSTLDEISEILNYKNKNFLISQFKKITGLPPSYFTELKERREKREEHL
ncbi:MAG: helix-turn-helix domain-containing protein [Balneolaceae bacterium]